MNLRSLVDFILLAALWGASFLFMRLSVGELGVVGTSAVRVAIASLVLLPLVAWRAQLPALRTHWKALLVMGLLNSAIPFSLYAFALQSISTGLSSILNAGAPLWGAVVAWLWLGERLSGSRMTGLGLGVLGVVMLAWDKAGLRTDVPHAHPAWAVLACVGATVCYGIAANAARRWLSGVPPLVNAAGSQIGATAGLALPALLLLPERMPGPQAWLAVAAAGVLCTGIAYILYFRLVEHTGPAQAVAVTFVVPVFALFYGALVLGEAVTPWMVFSGLVIVCGTALATGLVEFPSERKQA